MGKVSFARAFHGVQISILLLTIVCTGCEQELPVRFPVSGKILVNGQPAAGAKVRFLNTDEFQKSMPVAYAETGEDGSFRLSTVEARDGALPGEYRVTVVWPSRVQNEFGETVDGPDQLGGKYATPQQPVDTVTISSGNNDLEPFQLQKP